MDTLSRNLKESAARRILTLAAVVVVTATLSAQADAAFILQDTSDLSIQVNVYEPIGQSFTAEDTAVSFGFYMFPMNSFAVNDSLRVRLLAGDGLGGAQLASTMISPPSGFTGFYDVDLSSVPLTVGQQYTVVLDTPGTSAYWGARVQRDTDPYAGGRAYFTSQGSIVNDPGDDMRFRVTPAITAVPEPSSMTLLSLGGASSIVWLGWRRRNGSGTAPAR